MTTPSPIAFVDRDGTLILEPADQQVDRLDKVALVPGVIPAMLRLQEAGYRFVMATNQDGLGTASFPEEDFSQVQDFVLGLFASQGIRFLAVLVCPHLPEDGCSCRKPAPGLLEGLSGRLEFDREASVMIGDRDTDLGFARNIGVRGFLLDPLDEGAWASIVDAIVTPATRQASLRRETRETRINVAVNLDREGEIAIDTGIGFYDHMLEQIAKHGGFSLQLKCSGDLHVDEHHTVEDCALALGESMRQALGDKRGIGRYGFTLPMDEARATVLLDLSGRPYSVFEGTFTRERVGALPTELVPHFFRSFAESIGANLHIQVEGENAHHMVEACFKGLGRALRQALRREGSVLPSTKGAL